MEIIKVVVALCTSKRPSLLEKAITSLAEIETPLNYEIEFILVDNDKEKSGRDVYNRLRRYLPFNSSYVYEPQKGITFARNRALIEASKKKAKYLAFFDDDAVVSTDWLTKLVRYADPGFNAILTGPQLSDFDQDCPDWAKEIIYFNPKRHLSGSELRWAATNNILIPMRLFNDFGVTFDNSLRYSGGSDQCLSMEARKFGFKVVWVDDSIVREKVSLERANLQWVLNRSFRYGSTGFFMHRKELGYFRSLFLSIAKSIFYFLYGFYEIVFSLPNNRLKRISGICLLSRSAGWISGIFNKKKNEYVDR